MYKFCNGRLLRISFALCIIFLSVQNIDAQNRKPLSKKELRTRAFIFWQGAKSSMTIKEFAAYCAPVFWYSSDEPSLNGTKGKEIMIPQNFPFQKNSGKPVVYFQIRKILSNENKSRSAFIKDKTNFENSILNLRYISGIEIDYNHYYEFESGLGGHNHDTEQAQFKIYIRHNRVNDTTRIYQFIFLEAIGKAHALPWYDNISKLDTNMFETNIPVNILVEEGKHASCTDINGDGYYTPGYDVNVRKNDAWGVRDVIRSGDLFTADYQAFMSKIRRHDYKVLPPLPEDSPHRWKYMKDSVYAFENAVYELRPMPNPKEAVSDLYLSRDMRGYYHKNWPKIEEGDARDKLMDWWETGRFIKSIAVMARFNKDIGVSVSFPLLIFKNVETPIVGGWMVNRIYFQGKNLRDFGYNILFTPSASRFMDPYLAAGIERYKYNEEATGELKGKVEFVAETGIKFRANVMYSPLKFLSVISDFWGVRIGIKNRGFWKINDFNYVFEIGAGVW